MWSIEGVMNVLPVLADLQGSVCSWHDCVEYAQQSVQLGLVPESKICILCT
jgi:hypothetical protein